MGTGFCDGLWVVDTGRSWIYLRYEGVRVARWWLGRYYGFGGFKNYDYYLSNVTHVFLPASVPSHLHTSTGFQKKPPLALIHRTFKNKEP